MTILHGLLATDVADDASAVHASANTASLLSALGDPTRLAVLSHLRGGEHRVGELAQHLGLAQSTVSQHLAVLRAAGLISTHTHGRAHVSRLENEEHLVALLVLANALAEVAGKVIEAQNAEAEQ